MKNKQKTKKTLTKRVKITKSGKILKKKLRTSHLKAKWTANRKHRKAGLNQISSKKIQKKLMAMLARGK